MNITRTIQFLLIGVGILTGCRQDKKTDDHEIITGIITEYFSGIKQGDLNKMNSVTTPDFILFEDGKVWTNDSLANAINASANVNRNWTFSNMKVNVDESSADIVYFNHGDFTINDTTKRTIDWIESATFRKTEGVWKMNFLHSTVRD